MHPAVTFQLERTLREFARWHAVESEMRSPAPAWWWGPALAALGEPQPMPAEWSQIMGLPLQSSYATGAQLLLNQLAHQTVLPWPDDFPRQFKPPG